MKKRNEIICNDDIFGNLKVPKGMENVKRGKDGHFIVTWEEIFKDFQLNYPTLSKRVVNWWSVGFATIQIRLIEGEYMQYNYDTKRAEFIPEPKIKITSETAKKIEERLGEDDE